MTDETCANCGNMIGKLQNAYIFKDKIVCHKCNSILKDKDYQTKLQASSPPPLHVAQSSDLREINKSTSFLAGVVKVIITLTRHSRNQKS